MWSRLLLSITALTTHAYAETFHVDVGRTGLNFNPNTLHNVAVGDTVNFHFYPSNNSVAESTFFKPCKPKSGGVDAKPIYSGFIPTDDGVASTMWSMTINNSDTIWLYSSQGQRQHCRNGQSMVINPVNDTEQTLDAYMEAALKANVSSPQEVFGGVLVDDDGGHPAERAMARPSTTLRSSMTQTAVIVKPTSGVPAMGGHVLKDLGIWLFMAVVFVVTL